MGKPDRYLTEVPEVEGARIVLSELRAEGADESVAIENLGTIAQPLTNWVLASLRGRNFYRLPDGLILHPSSRVRIHSGPAAKHNPPADLMWTRESVWSSKSDTAVLFSAGGHEVSRISQGSPRAQSRGQKLLYRDDDGQMWIEDSDPSKMVNRKITTSSARARQ